MVDLARAHTVDERRALLRHLPVTVVARMVPGGLLKEFVAGGAVRARLFVPIKQDAGTAAGAGREVYEMADIDDPGFGGNLSRDECFYDDPEYGTGYDECASNEDIEDALMLAAALEAEELQIEADINELNSVIDEWCQANGCLSGGADAVVVSGVDTAECSPPVPACAGEVFTAAWELVGAGAARYSLYTTATAARVAAGLLAFKVFMAQAAVAVTAVALVAAGNCVAQHYLNGPELTLQNDVQRLADRRLRAGIF